MTETPKTYALYLGTDENAQNIYHGFEKLKADVDDKLSKLNKTAPQCKVNQIVLKKLLKSNLIEGIDVSVLTDINADEVARLKAERDRLDEQIKLYESKSK